MTSRAFTRREFVAAASALAAGALARGDFAADRAHVKPRNLKKALGYGMIGEGATIEEKFKLVKEIGFDGVEIDRPGKTPIEEILRARDAAGIEIPSVIDSVHWSSTLGDPDGQVRMAGIEALETALRDAKAVGAASVLLVPCVVNDKIDYESAWNRSQEAIRRVIPLAAELGVPIAVENVWNGFVMSPLEARRYVDDFGSPWVRWHFDVGNVVNYGWPEQWIRVLGRRIRQVHVKDFSRRKRDAEGLWKGFDVKLLEGDVDWRAVMQALDETAYSGWLIAEVSGGKRAALKDVCDRMTKILEM